MSSVLRALYDHSLSLPQRLKVARYLWGQEDILSEEKTAFLVKWVCGELCTVYNRKNQRPPSSSISCELWKFLSLVLTAIVEEEDAKELSALNIHLFQGMGVVFLSTAKEMEEGSELISCSEEALKCLQSILLLPQFPSALGIFETMVPLIGSVLELGVAYLRHTHQLLYPILFPAMKAILNYYIYLESCQGNRKKVFSAICNHLLYPSLRLMSLLRAYPYEGNLSVDMISPVTGGLEAIFRSLFSSDFLVEFSSALSSTFDRSNTSASSRSAISSTRLLFKVLNEFLESNSSQDVTKTLPVLLDAFLLENSNTKTLPKNIEFKFFCRILHLLGIQDESTLNREEGPPDPTVKQLLAIATAYFRGKKMKKKSKLKREACRECLELLLKYDVYQVAEDVDSDQIQTSYFKCLVVHVMEQLQQYSDLSLCFGSLSVMMQLNNLLVEPWLGVLWLIFPSLSSLQPQDNEFIDTCIETYAKLRQLPLLFEKQLQATKILSLCSSLTTTDSPLLPPLITLSSPTLTPSSELLLASHVASLPPGQTADILQLYVTYFLENIEKLDSGEEPSLIKMATAWSVDVFSVFLSSASIGVWSSRYKGKAVETLSNLVEGVCDKLLTHSLPDFIIGKPSILPTSPLFPTAALLLASRCCELVTRLYLHIPSAPFLPKWPVTLDMDPSNLLLPRQWRGVVETLQPATRYLLKLLALQQLRFNSLCPLKGLASVKEMLDFVFLTDEMYFMESSELWSGQAFSLVSGNYNTALCSLVLSQLTDFYESCGDEHLRTVAELILQIVSTDVKDREMKGSEFGLECIVESFLESEGFVEMRRLHHLLLSSYLSTVRYKSLPKPLKHVMKLCVKEGVDNCSAQEISASLGTALQHGLRGMESLDLSNHDLQKLVVGLKVHVYLRMVRVLPISSQRQLLLQSLLTGVVYQIISAHLLMSTSSPDDSVFSLLDTISNLTYVLLWHLQALRTAVGQRGKKRRRILGREEVDLFLKLWYYLGFLIYKQQLSKERCKAHVSNMVAMEMTLGMRATSFGYPEDFTMLVFDDLTKATRPLPLIGRVLHTTAEVMCVKLGPNSVKMVSNNSPHGHMCGLVLDALTQLLRCMSPLALVTTYPHLISTLSVLVNFDPTLEASRAFDVVKKLHVVEAEDMAVLTTIRETSSLDIFDRLKALMDCISLEVVMTASNLSSTQEPDEMEVDGSDDSASLDTGTGMKLIRTWVKLKQILNFVFGKETANFNQLLLHTLKSLGKKTHSTMRSVLSARGLEGVDVGSEEDRSMLANGRDERVFIYQKILNKVFSLLLEVVKHMSVEDIAVLLEEVDKESLGIPSSVLTFTLSWLVMLHSSLPLDVRAALRPHLQKVLFSCLSMAKFHWANGHTQYLVAVVIQLACQVISVPSHVGVVDGNVVLMSLQLCNFSNFKSSNSAVMLEVVEACVGLLTAVNRCHFPLVAATPGPFLVATNKLVLAIVKLGQAEVVVDSMALSQILHCASMLSRCLEMLSQQKSLYRFFAYIIHDFLSSSHKQPLHEDIKQVLLPGIFALIKVCNPPELAFLKASLELHVRESFLGLMEEFDRCYKFGGRV